MPPPHSSSAVYGPASMESESHISRKEKHELPKIPRELIERLTNVTDLYLCNNNNKNNNNNNYYEALFIKSGMLWHKGLSL